MMPYFNSYNVLFIVDGFFFFSYFLISFTSLIFFGFSVYSFQEMSLALLHCHCFLIYFLSYVDLIWLFVEINRSLFILPSFVLSLYTNDVVCLHFWWKSIRCVVLVLHSCPFSNGP
jgi:hypothetical protein